MLGSLLPQLKVRLAIGNALHRYAKKSLVSGLPNRPWTVVTEDCKDFASGGGQVAPLDINHRGIATHASEL